MYYGAGTYEAFAHPEKPEGVDRKSAYRSFYETFLYYSESI